jgi:hypothetical protein
MTINHADARQQWARKHKGWALTADIAEQARKFNWYGDWPEVDTDGHLTGEVVEPGGSDQWTVVDVMQSPIGRPYVQEGSGASMAVVSTADLQTRRAIETAAPSPGSVIGSVEIEQGHNSDWYVRVHLRATDTKELVKLLNQWKAEG